MIKKTVIIIGASSDIGLAVAKKFAKNGYNLALTYNEHKIDFAEEINNENIKIKDYYLNLLEKDKLEDFFKKVQDDFKYFESLVFCAGRAQPRELIFDVSNQELDELFEINIKSAIKSTREFSKMVINKNPANIVLIGSFLEKTGCACESVYTATKSAMSGFCKSIAGELGNSNIRINVVAPGFIDTKMNNNLSKEEKEEFAKSTPLSRLGTVYDIANTTYFLSTEESSFTTGQTFYIDGGLIIG